jgi:hypothetical protein
MHKSATKCNETVGKWCKNKHGASKIIDTLETYQPFLLLLRLRHAQSTVTRLWSPPETPLLCRAPSTHHGGAKLSQPSQNGSPPPIVVSSSGERQWGGRTDLLRAGWLRGSPPSSVQQREVVGNHGGVRQVNGKLLWPPKLRPSRLNQTFPRPIEPPLSQIEPTVEELRSLVEEALLPPMGHRTESCAQL